MTMKMITTLAIVCTLSIIISESIAPISVAVLVCFFTGAGVATVVNVVFDLVGANSGI